MKLSELTVQDLCLILTCFAFGWVIGTLFFCFMLGKYDAYMHRRAMKRPEPTGGIGGIRCKTYEIDPDTVPQPRRRMK